MAMATNLYYHCRFARVELQETHPFSVASHVAFSLYLSSSFVAPILLFHNSPHTQRLLRKKEKTKRP
jgi:hypothetical protein